MPVAGMYLDNLFCPTVQNPNTFNLVLYETKKIIKFSHFKDWNQSFFASFALRNDSNYLFDYKNSHYLIT